MDLIASTHYSKFHHDLNRVLENERFSVLSETLNKLVNYSLDPDIEVGFVVNWIYISEINTGFAVRESLEPDWDYEESGGEDIEDAPIKRK